MKPTTEQAKEFKNNYAKDLGFMSWSDLDYNTDIITTHETIVMQQFAEHCINEYKKNIPEFNFSEIVRMDEKEFEEYIFNIFK